MHSRVAALGVIAACVVTLSMGVVTYQFQERPVYQVGRQSDSGVVVPTNQVVSPAGTQITFAGRPLAIAVRPDQKTAAELNTGSGESTLTTRPIIIVDLVSGAVKQQFSPGTSNASYDGVLYSHDGAHLYFSQDKGRVVVANVARQSLSDAISCWCR